ncbi:indolepyruvate ferredoxin oxidoreductase family protein [Teichococcus vastitatis]|uniref:Indolepyruvate ferredoxin oxidoreductase family protein n=1 Tax=Teichococcus vastitatis TaxID=2307076 RepID=A0ABS9W9Y0_9PROT|nr:indolepyruvate ferredoxin oxidoreductase family protein [Pseudoroseomonas vastitatis]MCI0756047.1 indolepyruvate ferredoxin oxidoreductase family protein [Pseudoroseomonas vastitatis]
MANMARLPPSAQFQFDGSPCFLTGIQALVRLPMLQQIRDAAAGLNTAGFISGYRGSPLGGFDQALWRARDALAAHRITFQPGLNEELAATAVWGTQQVNLFSDAKHDGVFGLWYGKGPGADRSVDVFKHANAAGTSRHGGVLALVGDDHGAKSSSLPHQSDHIFAASMMPVLNPSGVQEFIDFGLHGWAMSRFSGCWVGLRAIADTVETSAAVALDPHRIESRLPADFVMPPDGLSIRWPDPPLMQERRLQQFKVYAAMAYAHANGLNRVVLDSPRAQLGIITTGKSYLDVRQALVSLGIDESKAAAIGLRIFKVGMTWPLDAEGVRHFAEGLEDILVVEEKRQVIEYQLKEQLYNWREDVRPRVTGKYDETGEWELAAHRWQLPASGELTPALIARVLARRIRRFHEDPAIEERLAFLDARDTTAAQNQGATTQRVPHYCSGCPHNTSTRVPEGSRALAGIGCHYMALWLNPEQTRTFSQMGGEGVAWLGQASFTDTPHVFANLGDGTYSHSGLLAIRQAVAARASITYKILFNDAVAMTGGQPVEGTLTVPQIARQVLAEGVGRCVVVAEDPRRHTGTLPSGVSLRHRRDLDTVQRELRDIRDVTVLIYDQTCAAEKRRRRKRGLMPDPARRVVINDRVCEGCGDCSDKSNCMSVVPVETEFGRKRAIDQSSCNKDFSCLDGFCPSFVTVEGGRLRQGRAIAALAPGEELPDPDVASAAAPFNILVTGVGGTGVVTIGALLGTAATLEGKGALVLDMAGLAQKGGPVWSHVRIADRQDALHASRIATGEASLLLGCDMVVAAAEDSLSKLNLGTTRAVLNSDVAVTSDVVRGLAAQARSGDAAGIADPDLAADTLAERIAAAVGPENASRIPASRLATALLGDSIATNLFMIGYASQKGLLPVSPRAILQAIELNGAAVPMNRQAFHWGRKAALDLAAVEAAAAPARPRPAHHRLSTSVDEVIARRVEELIAYQNRHLAERYVALVQRIRAAEQRHCAGHTALTEAAARGYHKLLAVKDEYEVARLFHETGFRQRIAEQFEGDYRVVLHLAPPLWSRPEPGRETPRKRAFGPWMLSAFGLLAHLRGLRGTVLDPFRFTEDRRLDRRLLADYEAALEEIARGLTAANHAMAVEIASLPDQVRGFGAVRQRFARHAWRRRERLLDAFRRGGTVPQTRPAAEVEMS